MSHTYPDRHSTNAVADVSPSHHSRENPDQAIGINGFMEDTTTKARYTTCLSNIVCFLIRATQFGSVGDLIALPPAAQTDITELLADAAQLSSHNARRFDRDEVLHDLPPTALETFHRIVTGVFHHEFERDFGVNATGFTVPLFVFVAFSAITVTGDWAAPSMLAPTLSALAWLARVVTFQEVIVVSQATGLDRVVVVEDQVRWVSRTHPTIFYWFRKLAATAASTVYHMTGRARCNTRGPNYIFDGVDIQHEQIHNYLNHVRTSFLTSLKDLLEYSGCPEVLALDLGSIADKLDCTVPGYSFLNDPANEPFQNREVVFDSMLATGNFHFVRDGKVQWRRDAIRTWRSKSSVLSKWKQAADYLCGGATSRGTESATYTQVNGERPRAQCWHKDRLLHFTEYHKGETITAVGKYFPRCFDVEYSDWAVKYMAFVRYADHLVAHHAEKVRVIDAAHCSRLTDVWPQVPFEVSELYITEVYHANGQTLGTGDLSGTLSSTAAGFLPIPLNVRTWRQLQVLITRTKILRETVTSSPAVKGIFDLACNHSEEVADSVYALDTASINYGNMNLLQSAMLVSTTWHLVSPGCICSDLFGMYSARFGYVFRPPQPRIPLSPHVLVH